GRAPDVARTGASLAVSGNTPAAWLARHLASNGYEPVEAARVGRALQTMGTPAAACADAACAAQLGRVIGVELVVFGRVIKVSDLIWLVEATLVDTGRGRILRSEQLELKGDVAQLLPRSMRSMARRLAAADPGRAGLGTPAAPGPQPPTLSRDQVLALLAVGNERGPIDLTGRDLSGLELAGVDFRSADMSRSRLVRTRLRGARMHGVKVNDAVATGADLACAAQTGRRIWSGPRVTERRSRRLRISSSRRPSVHVRRPRRVRGGRQRPPRRTGSPRARASGAAEGSLQRSAYAASRERRGDPAWLMVAPSSSSPVDESWVTSQSAGQWRAQARRRLCRSRNCAARDRCS